MILLKSKLKQQILNMKRKLLSLGLLLATCVAYAQNCSTTPTFDYSWVAGDTAKQGFVYTDQNGSAGGTISFDGGINFNNILGARECRVVKTLPNKLDDNKWKIETTFNLISGTNPGHLLLGLANDNQNIASNASGCPDANGTNPCFSYSEVKHNAFYALVYNATGSSGSILNTGTAISFFYKVNDGSGNYPQKSIGTPILIDYTLIGKDLIFKFERLSLTSAKASVYDGNQLVGSTCFTLPNNLTDLSTIQSGVQTSSSDARSLSAKIKSYKIFNACSSSNLIAPNATNVTINAGEKATLVANSNISNSVYSWFSTLSSTTVIGSNDTLITNSLNKDTTFYVSFQNTCGETSPRKKVSVFVNPIENYCQVVPSFENSWISGDTANQGFKYIDQNGAVGGSISFDGGIYLNNLIGARESRVVKTLPNKLDNNNWKIETTFNLINGDNPGHVLLGLANDEQNIVANASGCPDVNGTNPCDTYSEVKHNAFYALIYNPDGSSGSIKDFGTALSFFYKVNDGTGNYPQKSVGTSIIIDKSLIGKDLTFKLERLSFTSAKASLYNGNTLVGSTCFALPNNLIDLSTIQAGVQTSSSDRRELTALIKNYKFFNTCNPSNLPAPLATNLTINAGEIATLEATTTTSGAEFKWLSSLNSSIIINNSSIFKTGNLYSDTVFYVYYQTSCGETSPKIKVNVDVLNELGINNSQFDDLILYPNPTENLIFLNDEFDVQILNSLGIQVAIFTSVDKVDLSGLNNGIYFFKLSKNQKSTVLKVIKQ